MAETQDAAVIVVGRKGMHAGKREWFGNVPDSVSHKGSASVLITFSEAASATEGDSLSWVATGETDRPATRTRRRDELTYAARADPHPAAPLRSAHARVGSLLLAVAFLAVGAAH